MRTLRRTAFIFVIISSFSILPQKYIITGGECVGKSTVINLLQAQGYQIVPEGFAQVYHELRGTPGFEEFWSNLLPRERLLITRKIQNEQLIDSSRIAFLDRCALESVFFAEFQHTPIEQDLIELAQAQEYSSIVFMLDPLPEEFYERTHMRIQTRETAGAMHDHLEKRYKDYGFTVVEVPFGTPEERVRFILGVAGTTAQGTAAGEDYAAAESTLVG